MTGKTCVALRHVPFEDLGRLAPAIAAAGYAIEYRDVGVDEIVDGAVANADLLVVLGGPIGVYETEQYPFVTGEIAVIADRIAGGGRTLGICLGHQMIAAAYGAHVGPGTTREIGWGPVVLSEEGRQSVLAPLSKLPVLHWHGDVAELPHGGSRLAGTAVCSNQAFSMRGGRVLGLQFHIEADPARIEQWLIGHANELARAGIAPATIRRDTAALGPATAAAGAEIIGRWLAAE